MPDDDQEPPIYEPLGKPAGPSSDPAEIATMLSLSEPDVRRTFVAELSLLRTARRRLIEYRESANFLSRLLRHERGIDEGDVMQGGIVRTEVPEQYFDAGEPPVSADGTSLAGAWSTDSQLRDQWYAAALMGQGEEGRHYLDEQSVEEERQRIESELPRNQLVMAQKTVESLLWRRSYESGPRSDVEIEDIAAGLAEQAERLRRTSDDTDARIAWEASRLSKMGQLVTRFFDDPQDRLLENVSAVAQDQPAGTGVAVRQLPHLEVAIDLDAFATSGHGPLRTPVVKHLEGGGPGARAAGYSLIEHRVNHRLIEAAATIETAHRLESEHRSLTGEQPSPQRSDKESAGILTRRVTGHPAELGPDEWSLNDFLDRFGAGGAESQEAARRLRIKMQETNATQYGAYADRARPVLNQIANELDTDGKYRAAFVERVRSDESLALLAATTPQFRPFFPDLQEPERQELITTFLPALQRDEREIDLIAKYGAPPARASRTTSDQTLDGARQDLDLGIANMRTQRGPRVDRAANVGTAYATGFWDLALDRPEAQEAMRKRMEQQDGQFSLYLGDSLAAADATAELPDIWEGKYLRVNRKDEMSAIVTGFGQRFSDTNNLAGMRDLHGELQSFTDHPFEELATAQWASDLRDMLATDPDFAATVSEWNDSHPVPAAEAVRSGRYRDQYVGGFRLAASHSLNNLREAGVLPYPDPTPSESNELDDVRPRTPVTPPETSQEVPTTAPESVRTLGGWDSDIADSDIAESSVEEDVDPSSYTARTADDAPEATDTHLPVQDKGPDENPPPPRRSGGRGL